MGKLGVWTVVLSVCALVCGNAPAWITPDAEGLVIVKLASAPVVDGQADAVWKPLPWVQLSDQESNNQPGSDAKDHSARMKVGYTNQGIFFLVDVTDEEDDVSGSQPFHRDSVEIFIDLLDKREAASPSKWGTQGGPSQFRGQWYSDKAKADLHYSAEQAVPVAEDEAVYAVSDPSDGKTLYEFELKAPEEVRQQLRERIKQDKGAFGLVVAVNDADGGDRVAQFFWAGGSSLEPGKYNPPVKWRGPITPWQRSDFPASFGGDDGSIYAEAAFQRGAGRVPEATGSDNK
ncbi:MAG: hypothetical protein GWP08_11910 [Nitrospiraceae bacterium]|nr:hypothetical protein [Nitrospiraceae bacterium]